MFEKRSWRKELKAPTVTHFFWCFHNIVTYRASSFPIFPIFFLFFEKFLFSSYFCIKFPIFPIFWKLFSQIFIQLKFLRKIVILKGVSVNEEFKIFHLQALSFAYNSATTMQISFKVICIVARLVIYYRQSITITLAYFTSITFYYFYYN